jgi:levanase/fructan beta-fructosidase/levanbiose-producing levanase
VFRAVDRTGVERWVLLAVEAEERRVLVYSSTDLREWTFESSFGPVGPVDVVWECPDLVPLDVDGDPTEEWWVLLLSINSIGERADPDGSSMVYFVGRFDGHEFTSDDGSRWDRLDHGRDFYAGVTFANVPGDRRIMLGWLSNWRYASQVPTAPWRGAMSLPRELALRHVDGRVRLVQSLPAEVLGRLRRVAVGQAGAAAQAIRVPAMGSTLLDVTWMEHGPEADLEITSGAVTVARLAYDPGREELRFERLDPYGVHPDFASVRRTRLPPREGGLRLHVVLDAGLLEVFADDGMVVLSYLLVPGADSDEWTVTVGARERARADRSSAETD